MSMHRITIGPFAMGNLPFAMDKLEEQGWETLQVLFAGMQEVERNIMDPRRPLQAMPVYGILACKEFLEGQEFVPPNLNGPKQP
jgi:hypothetical protein